MHCNCNIMLIFATHFIRSNPPSARNRQPSSLVVPAEKRQASSPCWGLFRCGSAPHNDFYRNSTVVATAEKGGLRMPNKMQKESGMIRVFCRYIVRNGKVIYPKNGQCFTFLVKA